MRKRIKKIWCVLFHRKWELVFRPGRAYLKCVTCGVERRVYFHKGKVKI